MEHEDASEHARLRRAAFGRGATPADVEALAAFEHRVAPRVAVADPEPESEPDPEPEPGDAIPDAADPEPVASPAMPRWSARRRVAAGAVVALAVGAGVVAGVALAPRAEPASLAVFATSPTDDSFTLFSTGDQADVTQPGVVLTLDERLIESADGERFWGSVGIQNTGTSAEDPEWASMVCFAVELDDGSGVGQCETLHRFQLNGITVGAPDATAKAPAYRWGPVGGVQRLDSNPAEFGRG